MGKSYLYNFNTQHAQKFKVGQQVLIQCANGRPVLAFVAYVHPTKVQIAKRMNQRVPRKWAPDWEIKLTALESEIIDYGA